MLIRKHFIQDSDSPRSYLQWSKGHASENGTERGTRQRDKWLGLNSSSGTIFAGVTSRV